MEGEGKDGVEVVWKGGGGDLDRGVGGEVIVGRC